METKKKNNSTLSKAFSRTFGRKTAPLSPPLTSDNVASGLADPSAGLEKKHVVIDTNPTNIAPALANDIAPATATTTTESSSSGIASSKPAILPTETIDPPQSTLPVHFADENTHSQYNNGAFSTNNNVHNNTLANATSTTTANNNNGQRVAPSSPRINTTHRRDGTGMTTSSTASHQWISPISDVDSPNQRRDGLNPADILHHRLIAYYGVVKNLQLYFNEIALIESGISKAMHKASTMIGVPFKDGHQFLGKGGLQDVCVGVRESSKVRSDQHTAASRFIEETVVKNIRRLKQDIKGRIKALKSDTTLYETRVFDERMATQELIGSLAKAIGLFEKSGGHQPDMERMQSDPYVINLSLRRQLARQVHEENLFARELKQCQDQIMVFERHIINEIKQIMRDYSQHQIGHASAGFSQSWAPTEMALNVLQEDTEWSNFMNLNSHAMFPSDLVDADPEELDYPCKDSAYVQPLKSAQLSRRSTVLKNWREGYFVLTMAGWLHEFASPDPINDAVPERSIYLPTSVLGPHTDPAQKQHVFSLEGKGVGGLMHRESQKFTVRANSREEMLDWWSEVSKYTHSTTYIHQGDGQLDGSLSRTGSLSRSNTVKRSASRATRPQSPTLTGIATTANQQSSLQQQQSLPLQQQPVPLQQQPVPLQQQPGPLQQQPGPLQQQPGPLQQQPGPLQQQPVPLQQQPGPLQMQPGPLQQQSVPLQQQYQPLQQQPVHLQHQYQQQPLQQQGTAPTSVGATQGEPGNMGAVGTSTTAGYTGPKSELGNPLTFERHNTGSTVSLNADHLVSPIQGNYESEAGPSALPNVTTATTTNAY